MKLLMITTEGFDTFSGNNHLNASLIRFFTKKFFFLTFIQSFRGGPLSIPQDINHIPNLRIENINRLKINKNLKFLRFIEEIIYFIMVYAKVKKELLIKNRPDYIFVQFSGLSYFLISKLRKFKIPIIYNMQDLFPETLVTTGILSTKNLIYKLFKRIQEKSFSFVNKISVLSKDIKINLVKNYNVDHKKIFIIPNWISTEDTIRFSIHQNLFAKKYSLKKDKFIIQYAGNLGRVLDYSFIVSLAKKFLFNDKFSFQIVGSGSQKRKLENLVRNNKLNNISIFDIQPQNMVNHVYSYADIEIIPLKPHVLQSSVPSKLPFLLNLKIPTVIIGDKMSSYLSELIKKEIVFGFSNFEIEAVYHFLIEYQLNKSKFKDFDKIRINSSSEYSLKNYSSSIAFKKIEKLFNDK